MWGSSSWLFLRRRSLALSAAAPDLGCGVLPASAPDLGRWVAPLGHALCTIAASHALPCSPKDSQKSPALQFESISSLVLSLLYGPTLSSIHDYWKTIVLTIWTFVSKVSALFL